MLTNQLIQAATLFGLGMGTVFFLLTLLISCVGLVSFFCKNFLSTATVMSAADVASQRKVNEPLQSISALEVSIVKAVVKAHREANS